MRRLLSSLASLLVATCLCGLVHAAAQTPSFAADEAAIRATMDKSVADWNRGDLDAFATSYKNSPDILFIGSRVSRGYDGMLASYRSRYATAEARGVLTFSNIEIHPLDARFATLIGNCHLERTAAGGGSYDCIYSLVLEKTSAGWKIILDHSSALPAVATKPAGAP
jgi:uncharacterized protein (TIGR02246 family)